MKAKVESCNGAISSQCALELSFVSYHVLHADSQESYYETVWVYILLYVSFNNVDYLTINKMHWLHILQKQLPFFFYHMLDTWQSITYSVCLITIFLRMYLYLFLSSLSNIWKQLSVYNSCFYIIYFVADLIIYMNCLETTVQNKNKILH